jgi:hypothetical protein
MAVPRTDIITDLEEVHRVKKQPSPKGKPLTVPFIALGVVIALFASIPIFLSRTQVSAPPQSARTVQPAQPPLSVLGGKIVFRDAKAQAEEFIGYYHSIKLTPEQEAIKKAGLAMPAACCRDSSASTCCCPCNLSKTLWGLSNLAISKYGANANDVRQIAQAWLGYVNPTNGFTGDACYKGGCSSSAHSGGCAGMEESKLDI